MAADRICKRREKPLISVTSILILSAFLIGMAVGNVVSADLEPYVLACGLSGILAFMGLEMAGLRRRLEQVEAEKRHLEGRLERHVLSASNAGFVLPPVKTTAPAAEPAGMV